MANLVHLDVAQEAFLENERVRIVAKRAVAKPDVPFDALPLGAAMLLAQQERSAGLPNADKKPRPGK